MPRPRNPVHQYTTQKAHLASSLRRRVEAKKPTRHGPSGTDSFSDEEKTDACGAGASGRVRVGDSFVLPNSGLRLPRLAYAGRVVPELPPSTSATSAEVT